LALILVVLYSAEKTLYENGRILEEKGDVFVSHGINTRTGKVVILPTEKWSNFRHNCITYEGEWYLKEKKQGTT
jgi:hypothetical protein